MTKKIRRLGLLLALALTVSGCSFFGSVEWEWESPPGHVTGTVELRDLGAPLVNARVFFNGPINRTAVSNRSGGYQINLPKGTYNVTVRTLHDDYTTQVVVGGSQVSHLRVSAKGWYERHLFLALSGMRQYYFEGDHLRSQDDGEMARWEQPKVRVYFDTANAPWGARASSWADTYFRHILGTWRSLLKDTVEFERVYTESLADVVVQWKEAGTIPGPGGSTVAGIVRNLRYYANGALRLVRIEIDERFALEPGLWEHEWARAMGVGYSYDPYSLLYPALEYSQRTSLSSSEARHIQLMYDLPSGLRLGRVYSMALSEDAGDSDPSKTEQPELMFEQALGSGFTGHVRTLDGRVTALEPFEAQDLIYD